MSFKLVELQVALPRSYDAGKITEQLQQRGQVAFDQVSKEMEDKVKHNRHSVNKMEQKEKSRLKEDTSNEASESLGDPHHQNSKNEVSIKEDHPYKGNSIDYSG
ncbi:hypothetical protein [Bacillus sp. FSL K6-3431]|uniref:hypothetical protein n=1 Tax=Bacillus sp. FSL K6-3431 TaxID=2921500 RepID=UPI0030F97E75